MNKKISSIIVLVIILVVVCVLCYLDIKCLIWLKKPREPVADGEDAMMAAAIVSFVGAFVFAGLILFSLTMLLLSTLGLKFCVSNIKTEEKSIKAINIAFLCFFAVTAVTGIIIIILYGVL